MEQKANGLTPNGTATLTFQNKRIDLPVYRPTEGPDAVDIRKLYADTDLFTYDPGFTSTASCESNLTYIDGDKGILLYRGYPIDQLAKHSNFLEVCYLLLYGELPTPQQAAEFAREQGLVVLEDLGPEELTRRYLTGSDGRPDGRVLDWHRIIDAKVP